MNINRQHIRITLAVAILLILGVAIISSSVYQTDMKRVHERAQLNARVYAEELDKDFRRGIAITETFKTLLIDGQGNIRDFDLAAEDMMEDYIGSIQLARDGIVNQIYPLAGNEAGMIDLLQDPKRGPVSRYGRDQHVITMQGPFNLAQGGQGIAIRNPVFLPGSESGESSSFWGFTIVIIKSPEIFQNSMESLASFGYDYVLEITEAPTESEPIPVMASIDADERLTDAATATFGDAGYVWTFQVKPTEGWVSRRLPLALSVGSFLAILLTLMTWLILSLAEQKRELGELAVAAEEANRAKTIFLSNMAHNIRTPMNAVIGLSDLAHRHLGEPDQMKFYLDQISIAGDQLMSIINGILEISRIESGKVEIKEELEDTQALFDSLRTVFENQAGTKQIRFHFTNQIQHRYLYLDRAHVEEVLTNLINNAMKYTPEGGTVDISFTELPCDREGHALIRANIKDNGIGMSEEFQKKLFEKFERDDDDDVVSRVSGSGLGLAIVKHLLDMMGATITVSSTKGLGTLMSVDFCHRIGQWTEHTGVREQTAAADTDFAGKRILLVEDNDINAMIAEEFLKGGGFQVDRAVNGQECVNRMELADGGTYAAILMDLKMPVMDGFTATRIIRAMTDRKKAQIPIIAMTGNAFQEDREASFEAGMNEHMSKPIEPQKLFSTLKQFCDVE